MGRTRRSTGAPCNICEFYWPFHANSCAYKQTAEENVELKADLTSLGREHANLLEYTKELERRLHVVIH